MLLEEVDDLHFRWTLDCPTCQIEFGGVMHKEGWLQFDPICPKCGRMIAGFTNPRWPPPPEGAALPMLTLDEIVGV